MSGPGDFSIGIQPNSQIQINSEIDAKLDGNLLDKVKVDATLDANLDKIKAEVNGNLLDKIKAELNGNLLDKIKAEAGVTASIKELAPLLLTLLWTEIPQVKIASPHHYKLAFSILGFEVFSLSLHGESKAVTAKNPGGAAGDIQV